MTDYEKDYEKACIIAEMLARLGAGVTPETILAKASGSQLDFYVWWCRRL